MMMKRAFSLRLFCTMIAAAAFVCQAALAADAVSTYRNTAYRFTLQYPATWTVTENQMGTVVILLSPKEGNSDTFQENVNLVVQDLSQQSMSLDQYTDLSRNQIKQLITDSKIISVKKVKFAGRDGREIVYSGKQGNYRLQWMCRYAMAGNAVYLLTYTAEQNKYDKFLKSAETVFASFTLN